MWRYEFDSHGGYDGLAGAFKIYDDYNKFVCKIDQYYQYDDFKGNPIKGRDPHEPWSECEAIASFIVDAVCVKMEMK